MNFDIDRSCHSWHAYGIAMATVRCARCASSRDSRSIGDTLNRRVHEIAQDLKVQSAEVLQYLHQIGEYSRSASSSVSEPVAAKVYANFGTMLPDSPSEELRIPLPATDRKSVV